MQQVYIVTAGHDYEGWGQVGVYATAEDAIHAADAAVAPREDCCHHDYAQVFEMQVGVPSCYDQEAIYSTTQES